MDSKGVKVAKSVIQWILVVFCLFMAFVYLPDFTGILYLIGAAIILPIKPLENFFTKHKIPLWIRILIVFGILLFHIVYFLIGGGSESEPSGSHPSGGSEIVQSSDEGNTEVKADKESDVEQPSGGGNEVAAYEGADISGTWIYVEERPVEMEYVINPDGTWKYSSENGETDEGTYEIIDDNEVKMTGNNLEFTFNIISEKELEDAWGYKLKKK